MNGNLSGAENSASRIIKSERQATSALFGKLLKHQVLDAEQQARNILEKAGNEAAAQIEKAESEAEDIRRDAYQNGRDEAERELVEDLLKIKEQRAENLANIESEILRLAVKIAEKIIGAEIKQDETTRGEIVLNALRQTRQQEMLTVRVNHADLPLLENLREKIDAFGRAKYIDFVADQAVKTGGCVIESSSGTIDARLETQLRILETALLARVSDEVK